MFFDHISIPENYVGLIIGKKGKTIRKIEIKYNVKILVENTDLYLYTHVSQENIRHAKNEIVKIYGKKLHKEEKCPVCLGGLDMSKNFVVTKCGHSFHFDCLAEVMKTSNKCPMCREEISHKEQIDTDKIIRQTLRQMRRTNYVFSLAYYLNDIYSFQLVIEEFLKEPIRYALSQVN